MTAVAGGMTALVGATLIDGNGGPPIRNSMILVSDKRIAAIADQSAAIPSEARVIRVSGKYIIPGLMDANVHLLLDISARNLIYYEDRYEALIIEAAQVALRGGLTTVFDTWGPRAPLAAAREQIASGRVTGSRIFLGGNIVGLDGPLSLDFSGNALGTFTSDVEQRINALWSENVGPALSWMTPDMVAHELRGYIGKGVDFVKYASSDHRWSESTVFLLFSSRVQAAIVAEAHRAGITAQAHATSVESLRAAVDAGCDIVQHCNITGRVPIPEDTLERLVQSRTGAVVFPFTQRRFDRIMAGNPADRVHFSAADLNCRNLIRSGATLLLAGDAGVLSQSTTSAPAFAGHWMAPGDDNLSELGEGHFHWLRAMEEKGLPPMEGLMAATRNIAAAYGKEADLGTLEAGKLADLLVLDLDPLASARHYRSIHLLMKEGRIIDRSTLPVNPILTSPVATRVTRQS